jgi:SAM-dependent methyltransferase
MRGFGPESYGDAFADVYDEWYGPSTELGRELDATVAFLADLATATGTVLELGVGTGRIAIPLAARVGRVVGIDSSRKMLERLVSGDPHRTVTGVVGDMIEAMAGIRPDDGFDVIVAAYNTIFNLTSQDRQQECFAEAAKALSTDGVLVIDAFVPEDAPNPDGEPAAGAISVTSAAARSRVTVRSIAADRVVLSASVDDPAKQRADGQFIELTESGGVRLRPWSIRWAAPAELDAMATRAGLRLTQRWADYDRSPFDSGSTRHVSVYSPARSPKVRI